MDVTKMHNGGYEMAERISEPEHPRGQFAKPIDVDGAEYMPGVDVKDWSEEFTDYGGEG
jgi:hypothetical protein